MKRLARSCLGLVFIAGWIQPTFGQGVTVDQSFTAPTNVTALINECCAFVGQTYTAGITGTLSGVSVDVLNLNVGSAFPLDVQIRTVVNGLPTTTILGEANTRTFSLGDMITFAQQIPQLAGEQYGIVLHFLGAPPQGAGHAVGTWLGALDQNDGAAYPGGSAVRSFDQGITWSLPPPDSFQFDSHFRTFVTPVPEQTSLALIGAGLLGLLGFRRLNRSRATAVVRPTRLANGGWRTCAPAMRLVRLAAANARLFENRRGGQNRAFSRRGNQPRVVCESM